jgi:hypothetical protein
MRKKIPEEKKRKTVSFSIDPRVYKMWENYCEENGIENYSEYIELLINEKIKNDNERKIN